VPVSIYEAMFLLDSAKVAVSWDDSVRELILKVHPKLIDHLVERAMTSTPGADEEEGRREDEGFDRPRRRRRDE